jgi:hypothetical protein
MTPLRLLALAAAGGAGGWFGATAEHGGGLGLGLLWSLILTTVLTIWMTLRDAAGPPPGGGVNFRKKPRR